MTGRPEMAAFGDRRAGVKKRVIGTPQDAEKPEREVGGREGEREMGSKSKGHRGH